MLRIGIDFDGTLVEPNQLFADTTVPLRFIPGARRGVMALKRAGHILLLFSARANRALREDAQLDPLVRVGRIHVDPVVWARNRPVHQVRYEQMIAFVHGNLPKIFDAIDDGLQGKPTVDLFVDDKSIGLVPGVGWSRITHLYGEQKL